MFSANVLIMFEVNVITYITSLVIGILLGSLYVISDRIPCAISSKIENIVFALHLAYLFITFTTPVIFILYSKYGIDLLNLIAYWCRYGIMVSIAYGVLLRLELERRLREISSKDVI